MAMGEIRTARHSAKAQVEALFDSLALEYVHERERQISFVSQKRIVCTSGPPTRSTAP